MPVRAAQRLSLPHLQKDDDMAETKKKNTKKPPTAKSNGKKTCGVEGCKRAYRAKGFCFFHHAKWRAGEIEGRPARYKTCSKPDCKKKVVGHGLCQDHFDAWTKSRKKNQGKTEAAVPAA
jgi:hypothetical protein